MSLMKPDSKCKEIFLIVKSGIVGALALTSICIILFLIGFAIKGEFISYFYQNTFAKCSFDGFFITTSGLGFILGIIVKRHLTLKNEFILLAAFSIPLIIGAWLLNAYAIRVSVPHSVKLMDCTNTNMTIRFTAPIEHVYYIEFKIPTSELVWQHDSEHGTYLGSNLSGLVNISEGGTVITNLLIASGKGSGWIFLHKNTSYDLRITFDQMPPPSTSVWLYWLQTARERKE